MIASDKIVHIAEGTVYDDHVGDYLPIILLENGVSADGIHKASNTWDGVDQFQMERSTPTVVLMLSMDVLLLLSEHEPVEGAYDKVGNDGQSVEKVMSSLNVHSGVRGLKGVLSEVSGVIGCADTCHKGNGCEHQAPVGEWNEKAVGIHI